MTVAGEQSTRQSAVNQPAARLNIADRLAQMAARYPDKPAVIVAQKRRSRFVATTFRDLADNVDRLAAGLAAAGIRDGVRTILMVKPGADFFALTFALFKTEAVPVLIDPGMGRRSLVRCLAEIEAEAFIGIPIAHVARKLFRGAFRSIRIAVTVGRRWLWGGLRLAHLRSERSDAYAGSATGADDLAAILFTSGSTGPAKGACYTHGIFNAQVDYLQSHYGFSADDVDVATFPLFALFDAALGVTAVIPDMDASRPARADPAKIVAAIRESGATHMFGSPALLNNLARFAIANGGRLDSLRRVITAGAPVAPRMLEKLRQVLADEADIFTPYGATEALPVASIESREILQETAARTAEGAGICVGRPLDGMDVRIIAIDDGPIPEWSSSLCLPAGQIGEIVVNGPVVTREYFRRPAATTAAKIRDGDAIWHRMGDVGYLDDRGRLWFCGRKAHRVVTERGTLFTIPCEAVFNRHPRVRRTALVGVGDAGRQQPVLCVEPEERPDARQRQQLTRELQDLGRSAENTRSIETILFHRSFPVDVRHNAKINREALAGWAERQSR